ATLRPRKARAPRCAVTPPSGGDTPRDSPARGRRSTPEDPSAFHSYAALRTRPARRSAAPIRLRPPQIVQARPKYLIPRTPVGEKVRWTPPPRRRAVYPRHH